MHKRFLTHERILLTIYIGLFVLLAGGIALSQQHFDNPLGTNPPDESYRFLVPAYFADHFALPNGYDAAIRIPSYGISYGFYTYFPYLVQGFIMWIISFVSHSPLTMLLAARFVNVAIGVMMCVVVRKLGKKLFLQKEDLSWLFSFGVMFLPQHLFIYSYVNTDAMSMLSTALISYALVCILQDKITLKNNCILGLGISLCLMSYFNAYGFVLVGGLVYLYAVLQEKREKKLFYFLKNASVVAGIVLLCTGWMFVRNYILYDGDFLGIAACMRSKELYAMEEYRAFLFDTWQSRGASVLDMICETDYFTGLTMSFIGVFGSVKLIGPNILYLFFKLLFAAGILGYVLRVAFGAIKKQLKFKQIFIGCMIWMAIMIPFVLTIYYAYSSDFQNQGRYIMPALLPLYYILSVGIKELSEIIGKMIENLSKKCEFNEKMTKFLKTDTIVTKTIVIIIICILVLNLVYIFGTCIPAYEEVGAVLS